MAPNRRDLPTRPTRPGLVARTVGQAVRAAPFGDDVARAGRALALALLGLLVATGAAISDVYLHRGIETSAAPPYVVQASGRELATNIDLRAFPQDQVDAVASTLKASGFVYVRQVFSWAEIEPERGQFSWERYDRLVTALHARGIDVLAVLVDSPAWARAPEARGLRDAPPVEPNDIAPFVEQLLRRYAGRVRFVQVWDRPNLPERWGGSQATATEYLRLLAASFNAARTADPEAKVVLAELDPRGVIGFLGADVQFLRELYRAGGSAFFDIVAARVDGGSSSPYDRSVGSQRANLSRAILFRELMIDQGDGTKPIWLTHYGWNAGAGGAITREEQGDFLVEGMRRARAEWPWMGLMFVWDFLPGQSDADHPGFAILNADGTATPAFFKLTEFGSSAALVAGTGFVPMDSRPLDYHGTWSDQHLNQRIYRTTGETGASLTLRFRGTGVVAYLRHSPQAGPIHATLDGVPLPGWPMDGEASVIDVKYYRAFDTPVRLASGLSDETHSLTLTLAGPGQLTIGGLVVSREPPLMWPVMILTLVALGALALALRELIYVVATRTGHLQRRRGVELRPPLPHLPDWRPARRA